MLCEWQLQTFGGRKFRSLIKRTARENQAIFFSGGVVSETAEIQAHFEQMTLAKSGNFCRVAGTERIFGCCFHSMAAEISTRNALSQEACGFQWKWSKLDRWPEGPERRRISANFLRSSRDKRATALAISSSAASRSLSRSMRAAFAAAI